MRLPTEDGPLAGGTANRGRVVRMGDTVHRPAGIHTPAVHRLLTHLAASGFTGSPRVVEDGDVDQGLGRVEVLTYIEGSAATEPLAPWALTEGAVASVGELLRDYHRHASTFGPGGSATAAPVDETMRWQRPVPARWRGTLITHNDVNPANVIFRDDRAVALIDFDLAAPGTPAWELAVAACFWAPLRDDSDIGDSRRGVGLERFRMLLDGYRASPALRADVVTATPDANAWIAAIIHDASLRGHPAFGRLWAAEAEIYARADTWLRLNRGRLTAAAR